MAWSSIEFSKTLERTKVGRENQILSSDIKPFGRFPVIDQGQGFIAGYSDEENKVIYDQLPLVIFGDHTRTLKYVDFPFILGADGTKVLKPNGELFDVKFFYYALMSLEIPNRGYNRHFTLLKEKKVPQPEKDEQRKIASVLSLVQRAIEQQERLIALTTELKKSLMHKLFTEGLRGERQKQTEIGLVPESWAIDRVGNIASLKSGGTPSRSRPEYWQGGTIPWVKTGEVDYCLIRETEEKITQAGLDNSSVKLFPAGTLLMAMYGQGITRGKVATLGIEAAINQACVAFFPKDGIRSKFLYYFFESKYDLIRNLGHGANQKNLSADLLNTVALAYPSDPKDQDLIVKILQTVDDKVNIARKKVTHLSDLFRTLLHQLMTVQIRVHDLDLSELVLDSDDSMH